MQIGLLYLRPSRVTLRASCHMLGGHPQEPPGTPPLCHEQPPPPPAASHPQCHPQAPSVTHTLHSDPGPMADA